MYSNLLFFHHKYKEIKKKELVIYVQFYTYINYYVCTDKFCSMMNYYIPACENLAQNWTYSRNAATFKFTEKS